MRLLEQLAEVAQRRHLAPNTVEAYRRWVVAFLTFNRRGGRWRHPRELGAAELGAFLTYLAVDRRLSASSPNQAANAVVFLYKRVLVDELPADQLGAFAGERSGPSGCRRCWAWGRCSGCWGPLGKSKGKIKGVGSL